MKRPHVKKEDQFTIVSMITIALLIGYVLVGLSYSFGYTWLVLLLLVISFVAFGVAAVPTGLSKTRDVINHLRWWHVLWLMLFLSGLVFRQRDIEAIQTDPLDFWAIYRIGLVAGVALVLLGSEATRRISLLRSLSQGLIGLAAIYALMNIVSTLWSIYPLWTLYKSTEYLIDVALVATILASVRAVREYKTLFDWTWILIGFLAGTVWLGALVWPDEAVIQGIGLIGFQIKGIMPAVAANSVGDLGAILGIVSMVRFLQHSQQTRRFYAIIFLLSLITLVTSQSRSALTGFIIAIPLVFFASRRIGLLMLTASLAAGIVLLTNAGDVFWQFFLRGNTPAVFRSLGGRVVDWEYTWNILTAQPLAGRLLGFGGYAGSRFLVRDELGWSSGDIHSAYFLTLAGTGFIGLIPLLALVLGTWWFLWRSLRYTDAGTLERRLVVEAIGVLAVVSVRSVFSAGFVWHPALTALLIVGYAELLRRRRKIHTSQSL